MIHSFGKMVSLDKLQMLRTWASAGVVNDSGPNEVGTSKRALPFAAHSGTCLEKADEPLFIIERQILLQSNYRVD